MFKIDIAGIIINVDNEYPFVENVCRDFIIESESFDFSVSVTRDDFENEKRVNSPSLSDGFIESVCIYRSIAKELPRYNAFVFHSAAIEYGESAYCFTAHSGIGKTTHAMLWKQRFGDAVSFINGDKPVLRIIDGTPYVCGTPWGGKEDWKSKRIVPLKAICFLERACTNTITQISKHNALIKLLPQLYFSDHAEQKNATLSLLEIVIENSEFWYLKCTPTIEAAEVCFNTIAFKE